MRIDPLPIFIGPDRARILIEQSAARNYYSIGANEVYIKHDRPRQVCHMRPAVAALHEDGRYHGSIVERVSYHCPVRGLPAVALQDVDGRYWLGMTWIAGGQYSRHGTDEENGDVTVDGWEAIGIYDAEFRTAVANILYASGVGVDLTEVQNELVINARFEYDPSSKVTGPKFQCWGDIPEGFIPDRTDEAKRYWSARSALIYKFDHTWGEGSYHISQRAARVQHRKRTALKRYKQRRRTTEKEVRYARPSVFG